MSIRQDAKDKSIVYIESIIKLPVAIVHNGKSPERVRRGPLSELHRLRRVCVGPAKFKQTTHTVWCSDQPSGKYLAFDVEWPETPAGSNYFEGCSILVLVTDQLHHGDLVLASTENGFRLINRVQGGKFMDASDHSPVKRSSFIPIGVVTQESGWLKRN